MKKTLVMIFTVFVIAASVFAVFAFDNAFFPDNSTAVSESVYEPINDKTTVFTEEITSAVTSIQKETVGIVAARENAVAYVSADPDSVIFTENDIDAEPKGLVYEIEFCHDGIDYDCDVDAYTGEVIKCEKEYCKRHSHKEESSSYQYSSEHHTESHIKETHHGEEYHSQALIDETQYYAETTVPITENASESVTEKTRYISLDDAKEYALGFTGINAENAVFSEKSYDFDDGYFVYELEFCSDGMEYDCDVDAISGKIIKCEKDICDDRHHSHVYQSSKPHHEQSEKTSDAEEYISYDEAKNIALKDCALQNSDVYIKCDFDRDDAKAVYEIEIKKGRYEYEYEIDALSGKILERDFDIDD